MGVKGIFSSPMMQLVLPLMLVMFAGLAFLAFPPNMLRSLVTNFHRRREIQRMSRTLKRVGEQAKSQTAGRLH